MKYLTLIFLLLAGVLYGQSEQVGSHPYYVFLSGKMSVQFKGEYSPVTAFDGSRLRLESSKRGVKPSHKLLASLEPIVAVGNLYAEVEGFDYSFRNSASEYDAMQRLNDMNSDQIRFQQTSEAAAAGPLTASIPEGGGEGTQGGGAIISGGSSTNPFWSGISSDPFSSGSDTIQELDRYTYDETIDGLEAASNEPLRDTLEGECFVIARQDLQDAYGAVVLSFEIDTAKERLEGTRRSVTRIFSVGDLKAGESKKVKFACRFTEREINDEKVEVFLFDGKGQHVATNMARAIKEITPEQLKKFRELEQLESSG